MNKSAKNILADHIFVWYTKSLVFDSSMSVKSRKASQNQRFRLLYIVKNVVCEYYFKNFFIILFKSFGL